MYCKLLFCFVLFLLGAGVSDAVHNVGTDEWMLSVGTDYLVGDYWGDLSVVGICRNKEKINER